jgi:hypothetical protein
MYEETRQVYVSREMHLASWLIAAVMSLDKSSACGAAHEIIKTAHLVALSLSACWFARNSSFIAINLKAVLKRNA